MNTHLISRRSALTLDAQGIARRRRRKRRMLRLKQVASSVVLLLVAFVLYEYMSAMSRPSSLPLGVRSVEWLRANEGAWLVNDVERIYYKWKAPHKGGPPLKALPAVGLPQAASRPAPIRPLLAPSLAGEGVWHPTGPPVRAAAPVLVTTFRPEPDYPRIVAYVAWIDHTRAQLALYPGRYEPPSSQTRGPMEVPFGQRSRLLATFNSGFTYRDGHGGFAVNGHEYTPLQSGLGTLVGYRDGRVDIVSWQGGPAPGPQIALARQNLPLIVNRGRPNPNLNDGPKWGATLGNAILVWRSGVGVDRHGNLIYAAANYQTVRSLAGILIHAGAVRAIELDINGEWPSFITYQHGTGLDPNKLVPNDQQPATRYLSPDDRDFFAVYGRIPGPVAVPFK